jgi:hypothetical protein
MTDEEFFKTIETLRDHAKLRRQESLTAADVEKFKKWDNLFGEFHTLLLRRETALHLKGMKLPGGDAPGTEAGAERR